MKNLYITMLLALLAQFTFAQNSLSGKIINNENQEPLEQVSLYFPQLEKGTVTDVDGYYEITNLPTGKFKIVISYIGFQSYSQTVDIIGTSNQLSIALTSSAIEMEEVIVSTPFHKLQRENVMKVERTSIQDLKSTGAINLSEGITTIPGVESVSTGVGIGKPVIRGLSSNRVLTYTQGILLENQQFGDEHGLGISDAGIESVEVIKGPASLLYGSDALGGVLYLNPEKFANSNEINGDINLNYFTNTQGFNGNGGFKTSSEKLKFLVRAGGSSHIDYKTGGDERVTNSRFNEKDLKTGLAYQLSNFKTEIRYNYNNSELGIPEEIGEQSTNRTPLEPFQNITSHILSSKTNIYFNNSSLQAIIGYTANNREEYEDHHHEEEHEEGEEEHEEESPALDMKLETLSYNIHYNLAKIGAVETIIGVQGMNQTNKNYGEEILIPNATTNDVGILATSHIHFNKSDIQLGLRFDTRTINSEQNGIIEQEGYVAALDKNFNSFNIAAGFKFDVTKSLITRVNIASGFRAPNLAELTSNGSHEGTNRFEVGNANLNNERNIQTDVSLEFKNEHFEFYVNGFYNSISDYIYLEPNGTNIDGDAVFLYQQQDANLFGGEVGLHYHPHPLDWLHLESNFSTVTGELKSNGNLPLIPANNWANTLRFEFSKINKNLNSGYGFLTLKSFFAQNKVSDFETSTDGYTLLNLGIGSTIKVSNQLIDLKLSAKNILDKEYISHLSRLKTDGILNIGRNVNLGISIPL
ncbi:TonB-dependent receptor [Maribacter hydrothermalis]|uniref:TonB-dependent receptor n=1 Tax=Maribacter hydrothermalis TaxID=1836467 RepID=A0A1B7Z8T8_9FLAO|nr:TonB-dependent receptor [Maribacter hydrothermalis]APQ18860.1 TonB-dependent receptor [Maribacter hydrothermalis]OBR39127.1 TonB-dependent receptor [Maribacter hydrothermalis]